MRILFSLECMITEQDAELEESFFDALNPFCADASLKKVWVENYQKNLNEFIKKEYKGEEDQELSIITDATFLHQEIINEFKSNNTSTWRYLIMLECILFTPYFPLDEKEQKKFKGLKMSKESRDESLKKIASWMQIDFDFIDKVQNQYQKAARKMTGYYNKVLIGIGAGLVAALLVVATAGSSIVAMFAAEGLYGAAAISSGLAALGGGAVAAGGFGITGGIAVLVGGGVLLGSGAGASVAMTLATAEPYGIMAESAKLFVVLKEIVIGEQHDTRRAQEIILSIMDKISKMKAEILNLKRQQEENKQKIKNLEKSIEYLEKFIKMSE